MTIPEPVTVWSLKSNLSSNVELDVSNNKSPTVVIFNSFVTGSRFKTSFVVWVIVSPTENATVVFEIVIVLKTFEDDEFKVPVKVFSKSSSPYETTNACSSSITIVESSG